MKSLKKVHFYYGAILAAIMEYNPEASLALIERKDDNRKMYKIQTENSQDCFVFFKHAFEKKQGSQSWVFQFSEKERDDMKFCYAQKIPVFIYLLCGVENLKNSEIAILKYDEFQEVEHKKNFTIGLKKNFPKFYLHRTKSPKDDIEIPRNRIERSFDDLIAEVIDTSHGYYCPKCGKEIMRFLRG